MAVTLTPKIEEQIRQWIDSGRYPDADAVTLKALEALGAQEQARFLETRGLILAGFASGNYRELTPHSWTRSSGGRKNDSSAAKNRARMSARKRRRLALSDDATLDLEDVLLSTQERWGAEQRRGYPSRLVQAMRSLLDHPELGPR
jgi:putative addiction module CopG family antidote